MANALSKRGLALCAALICSVSASALLAESDEDRNLGRDSRKTSEGREQENYNLIYFSVTKFLFRYSV